MQLKNYENIQLIIFDCDGVLIDSEIISVKVLAKEFSKIGININSDYVLHFLVGHSYSKVKEIIHDNFNINIPDDFEENYRGKLLDAFDKELKIIPGIENILKNLNILKCVATGSSMKRATNSLKIVDILKYFKDDIFSAYDMHNRGKPAPDIYLLAAKYFNIKAENILVIEDSLSGIEGAKIAGMKVWHFIGASHLKSWDKNYNYAFKPDFIFNDMNNFFKYLPLLSNAYSKELL